MKKSHIFGILLMLATFGMPAVAWASTPPVLLDVVEIVDPAPFIIHENILPGDTFVHPMTVKNLTGVSQNMVMSLHIDLSQGIQNPPHELEERINVTIERVGSGLITLPGGGTHKTLQDLSDTLIDLGSISGLATQDYKITFVFDPAAGNEYQNTKVYFNVAISIEVPDAKGSLIIEKTNDSVAPEAPGNDVQYTLKITAVNGDVDDIELTDLPPAGFVYEPGSGAGAPFIHEYASPGVWDIGDLAEGESKTVTYTTKISDNQDDGLYKDLAFARGVSTGGVVLAVDESDSDNFVGTQVEVLQGAPPTVTVPQDDEHKVIEKTKKKIKYVLGASILPLTGTNSVWTVLALALLVTGIGLALWGKQLKKKNDSFRNSSLMKTFLLLIFAGSLLLAGESASAASLSVKIEKPEAVVNNPNFKIGFVALDIEGRAVTVECYETTGGLFESHVLNTGGSSGDCQVSAAVLTAPGDYSFFVKAITTSGASETSTSETVPVKLVASAPGTPFNYDRNDGSCQNVITFTTANDGGKTVKVELYRSASTSFTADASTFVADQAIGSNANGSFTEAAPGCSNDYYYALRAVDVYGFGSGFVGDKNVDVHTSTVTHNKTKTVTTGGPSTGAIATSGGAGANSAQVEGAETTTGSENVATPQEGSVLGEATTADETPSGFVNWVKAHPWYSLLGLLAVLYLVYLGYQKYQAKQNGSV